MNNKKILILIVLVVICMIGLIVGSIAYYQKIVSGSLTVNTGKAIFVLKDSDGTVWNNKVIELGEVNPGDSGSFDIVMDASGSDVDMYATLELERNNLPTNLKFYTNPDHKSQLNKRYTLLEKTGNTVSSFTVYWYWDPYVDDLEDSKYINKSLNVTIKVNAIQISEYATMKNGYGGWSSEEGGTEFWNKNYRIYIKNIEFSKDLSNLPSTCTEENLCWDISESSTQKNKVYGYLVDNGLKDDTDNTKPLYDLYIVSEVPIFAPSNCEGIFGFFKYGNDGKYTSNLTQINFNDNFNTSKVTNMQEMFNSCIKLINLDVSKFNTTNVNSMGEIFVNCYSLTNVNLTNFDTRNVTNIWNFFANCYKLETVDLSSFDTANVTNMGAMFYCCKALSNIDISNFNTSKVARMFSVFLGCRSLISLDLSNLNTSNVTNMRDMFQFCSSLTSLDLSNFNTSKVTDMNGMFSGCSSLTSLDLSSFNTAKVTDMSYMFTECSSLERLDLSNFNTSNITYMSEAFSECSSLTTKINIMNSNVTEYDNMFSNAATKSGSQITVNYIADASTLVDNMIATKSENSNVVKGVQI